MGKAFDEFQPTPWGDGAPRMLLGSAIPTSGTFYAGDFIINSAPGSGIFGWACVTGGTTGGTWTIIPLGNSGQGVAAATAAPASGTYSVGDVVLNSAPAAGQPSGWVCVTAPNTFLPIGEINLLSASTVTATAATLSGGSAFYLLNAASGPTVSMPQVTAYAAGAEVVIKNIANNSATLAPLASNGYVDAAAVTLTQNQFVRLRSFGTTNWYKSG